MSVSLSNYIQEMKAQKCQPWDNEEDLWAEIFARGSQAYLKSPFHSGRALWSWLWGKRCIKIKIKGLRKYSAGRLSRLEHPSLEKHWSFLKKQILAESQGQGRSEHGRCRLPSASLSNLKVSLGTLRSAGGLTEVIGGFESKLYGFQGGRHLVTVTIYKWMNEHAPRKGWAGWASKGLHSCLFPFFLR